MQKTSNNRADWQAARSWLSTARWAMRSAPLAGRFFSAKRSESHYVVETIVESFDESLEGTPPEDDQYGARTFMDPPPAPRTEARKASAVRDSDHSGRQRVVLFVPRPITEADLLKENVKHARTIKLRQRQRKRFRWLSDNAGTILVVLGLMVLAWFVGAN
jgi:hypothetical protein